jgi:outer membrane lipoprotein SlyB
VAALVLTELACGKARSSRIELMERNPVKKLLLAASTAVLLSACGTQIGDRAASGAAIGGGAGLVAGGIGAIPGAIIGAGVGAFTTPDQVNLGEPVWDDGDDPETP